MRVILIGAPGSGKARLAEIIRAKFPELTTPRSLDEKNLGYLTDYRVEFYLAALRDSFNGMSNTLLTHTLLDSVAYTTVRTYRAEMAGLSFYQWDLLAALLVKMTLDSLTYDYGVYLPYRGDDEFARALDTIHQESIFELELPNVIEYESDEAVIELLQGHPSKKKSSSD